MIYLWNKIRILILNIEISYVIILNIKEGVVVNGKYS